MLIAGFAHVHLAVHHAGQDVKPAHIDGFGGVGAREIADGGDAAFPHGDIGDAEAVMIDKRAALQDEIICFGHARPFRPEFSGVPRARSSVAAS